MKPNRGPGKLIVLEGLDGAGTTTQASRLAARLRSAHHLRVWITREPSEGPAGAQIRAVLGHRLLVDRKTLAALFAADRLDHLYCRGGVAERLRAGEWVLMDRYYLSSFAYQILALDEHGWDWLTALHAPCLVPDVTFFLDTPVEVCLDRIRRGRGQHFDLFERKSELAPVEIEYQKAIARLRAAGEDIQSIDGTQPVETVEADLCGRLEALIAAWGTA